MTTNNQTPDIPPHQAAHARNAFEGMLEHGRSTVRILLLVNGGSIVALLAFAGAIYQKNETGVIGSLVPGIWAFTIGLMLTLAVSFSAYLNFFTAYDDAYRDEKGPVLGVTQYIAIGCGIAAAIAFLVGVSFTSCALTRL